jgi:hypothetical protein
MAALLGSEDQRLMLLFDALSHPLHVAHPEWNFAFDTDREQTTATREPLLDRAAREALLVAAYHFPFPEFGSVNRFGDYWVWAPAV